MLYIQHNLRNYVAQNLHSRALLSGAAGLGWHLEGGDNKATTEPAAAVVVQWGNPKRPNVAQCKLAICREPSQSQRPKRIPTGSALRRIGRVDVSPNPRRTWVFFRNAFTRLRCSGLKWAWHCCRLYKISALDISYRIRFLCAFVIVGIAIVVVAVCVCCSLDCCYSCCCCCCYCSCCALFWFSNLWLS